MVAPRQIPPLLADEYTLIRLLATSVAPTDIENQKKAISSWQKQGFSVISLNSSAEIEQLEKDSNLDFIPVKRDASQFFGKPLVYLDDLLENLRDRRSSVSGIINADIYLKASPEFLQTICEQACNSLVFGSRIEVDSIEQDWGNAYPMGFDFFLFDQKLLNALPTSP
ncbi:MAG: hypothetical protein F6K32_26215, partial [Desertifilum sp. SIO1I2]|nr:hypothetical protein [Desertifilum sp. SIO1I2]